MIDIITSLSKLNRVKSCTVKIRCSSTHKVVIATMIFIKPNSTKHLRKWNEKYTFSWSKNSLKVKLIQAFYLDGLLRLILRSFCQLCIVFSKDWLIWGFVILFNTISFELYIVSIEFWEFFNSEFFTGSLFYSWLTTNLYL